MAANYRPGEGIHLVELPEGEKHACGCFRVGAAVPFSGIYRAFHDNHRLAHEVTLLADQVFPRCKKCCASVHFELVAKASGAMEEQDFRIQLYEIPHPELTQPNLQSIA